MSVPGFCPVADVTLQVGGVALRSGLCCDSPDGFSPGSVEVFLVQVFRCKSCLFTCGEEGHMTTHLSTHLSNQTHQHSHMMSGSQDFIQTGDKEEEDEELFLYDMFDISAQGAGLQAHSCQVSSLFEDDSLFKEETDQSAHLRTLGLCRTTARSIPKNPAKNSTRTTARTRTSAKNSSRTTTKTTIKTRTTAKTKARTTAKTETSARTRTTERTIAKNSARTMSKIPSRTSRTTAKSSGVHLRPSKTGSDPPRPPHRPGLDLDLGAGQNQEEDPQKQTGFYCSVCDRRFSSALTLRRHTGIHSDLRPFTCRLCSYSSRLKASLLQHLRTHTGERPFRCSLCPYASIDRSSLLRHKRTHSNERPHSCPHCHYCSIQKKSLDLHMQRHHS